MKKKILLTAFGPFENVANNPSQLVIDDIKKKFENPLITYKILDVSYDAVNVFLDELDAKFDLIIHTGVAYNNIKTRIEVLAKNKSNGKDVLGSEPDNDWIFENGVDLQTTFPKNLINSLMLNYENDVVISDDAGAYLCNYIYYKSLTKFNKKIPVIFIHVSDFISNKNAIGMEIQSDMIIWLINEYDRIDNPNFQ